MTKRYLVEFISTVTEKFTAEVEEFWNKIKEQS